jgi:asparagine synthase (glutamine-hydrolysing)
LREDYVAATGLEENARQLGFDPDFLGPWRSRQWRSEFYEQGEAEGADTRLALCELHQIPFRDPCSSRRLVEFCLAIPDDQYVRHGQSRWLARRMLRGRVPDMVVEENRIGRQAADWMLRIRRQRAALIGELCSMEQDPFLAERLDLAGLRHALETMPDETPLDSPEAFRLQLALPRALSAARFHRFVDGRNR